MFGGRFYTACLVLFVGGFAMLPLGGCGTHKADPTADGSPAKTPAKTASETELGVSPKDVLLQMAAAYKNAKTYHDQGVLRLTLDEPNARPVDQAPLEVALVRPGKIRIHAYQGLLLVDGKTLYGQILDAPSQNLDGQVLQASAPEKLQMGNLLFDPLLAGSLGGGMGLLAPQLELLLADQPLQTFLDDKAKRRLAPDDAIEGLACRRVEVSTERGKFVFWIDRETHVLRRLQYPDLPADPNGSADAGGVGKKVRVTADFRAAAINENVDEAMFQFTPADDAKRVSMLVMPPQPLPTDLFTRKPGEFSFHNINGGKDVSFGSLLGKPQVLVWFNDFPGCQEFLSQLEQARKRLPDPEIAGFWAVCTEPSDRSDAELRTLAKRWGLKMPVVRDLKTFGRDLFQIDLAPTLVVLDVKGRVQVFERGSSPNLADVVNVQLATILQRLSAGDDLAGPIVAKYERDVATYVKALNAVRTDGGGVTLIALPQTSVAPRQEPTALRLTPLWTRDDLEAPRSLLFVDGKTPRFVVLSGSGSVVELDAAGKTLAEHALALPEDSSTRMLRAARDENDAQLYVTWSVLGGQLQVFDQQWQLKMTHPAAEQRHEGIRDVRLVNLDGESGLRVAVGFWGAVGVQLVSLAGERLWTNRQLTNVLSLCTTPKNIVGWRQLLVTGDRGEILPLNHFGKHDPAVRVAGRLIHHLYSADVSTATATQYCGISYLPEGRLLAIGLNEKFEEVWSYPLPEGAQETPVELAASFESPDGGQRLWMLAGPDSSLHFVQDDGDFSDYFQTGQPVQGAVLAAIDGKAMLVVSDGKTVSAWRLAPAEK